MELILERAIFYKLKTIAIPAFGTGKLRYPPEVVAGAMFSSIQKFRNTHRGTCLETVRFVVFHKDLIVVRVGTVY